MNIESRATEAKKEEPVFELFNLTGEQTLKLRQEIEKHKGLIRVFVHPIVRTVKNHKRVEDIFSRVVDSTKAPPVIVLDNEDMMGKWKSSINRVGHLLTNKIYLVPTLPDFPSPVIPGKPQPPDRRNEGKMREEDFEYVHEGIVMLIKLLSGLGVKKIMVGETSLDVLDDHLNYCVGNFINLIKTIDKGNLELKLSMGTAPKSKTDIQKTRPGLVKDL